MVAVVTHAMPSSTLLHVEPTVRLPHHGDDLETSITDPESPVQLEDQGIDRHFNLALATIMGTMYPNVRGSHRMFLN